MDIVKKVKSSTTTRDVPIIRARQELSTVIVKGEVLDSFSMAHIRSLYLAFSIHIPYFDFCIHATR